MLSRALSLATVMLLIGGFAAIPAQAQNQNLEAGKSPSQIFAGTCTACHKSPRGLLKTVAPGSLPGFLRQHYTTSSEMAAPLSAFLISNGAADTRVGAQTKPDKDAKPDGKPSAEQLDRFGRKLRPGEAAKSEPQQAAKPDADGISPPGEPGRQGRNAKRLARPGEAPEGAKPAAESERGPDGRTPAGRLKLSKRGKPGSEEPPKIDAAKDTAKDTTKDTAKGEPSTTEPIKDDKPKIEPKSEPKSETAKDEGNKPEGAKPSETAKSDTGNAEAAKSESAKSESTKSEVAKSEAAKSETAKVDAPKAPGSGETPVLRADPVPAVTPAPKSAEVETRPAQTAAPAASSPPVASGTAPIATAEPAAPPAVTASAPPVPAGPPAPPISQ